MSKGKPLQRELVFGNAPAQVATRHQTWLDGQWLEYVIKRSLNRRSITLTIDEDGLRVAAPWRASQRRIEFLLGAHARWIKRKLGEWQGRKPSPFTWQPGAAVMVLGEPLTLKFDPARAFTARDGSDLLIARDAQAAPGALAVEVLAWLRRAAQDWFERRAEYYAPAFDVTVPAIFLSNAKTRWGTCHRDGRVRLNWRLIQMPPKLIDYVVVHELAHLREPNHSRDFWRQVSSVLPDFDERRRALRREGPRYLLA